MSDKFMTELNTNLASLGLEQEELASAESDSSAASSLIREGRKRLGSASLSGASTSTAATEYIGEDQEDATADGAETFLRKERSFSTDERFIEIIGCSSAEEYLHLLKESGINSESDSNWRLNPVLGPSMEVVKSQTETEKTQQAGNWRFWLILYGKDENGGKHPEILLTKVTNNGPIILQATFQLETMSETALQIRLNMLAAKVKALMPSAMVTPGGSLRHSSSSPLTNVYAVFGPAALADGFAKAYALSSKSVVADISPRPLSFRNRKMKLTHLPSTYNPPGIELSDGFAVRLAAKEDDVKAITKLMKGYKEEISALPSSLNSFDTCFKQVQEHIRCGTMFIFVVSSRTCPDLALIAGFLTIGSRTRETVAITKLFTHPDYRDRNVGESLVRTATNHLFGKSQASPFSNVVALVPDAQETASRVFSRVGFRVLDKAKWETTSTGDDEGSRTRPKASSEQSHSYLSWETWIEARFDGVNGGAPWHASAS